MPSQALGGRVRTVEGASRTVEGSAGSQAAAALNGPAGRLRTRNLRLHLTLGTTENPDRCKCMSSMA
jgi:hypothetical protein